MSEKKHPITIEDLYRIATVEDPRISPDGQWIAYVHVTIDSVENTYKRNLWLVPISGGNPIQITRSGKDSQPRWSPDGSWLAFVSGRDKKPQIYLLPVTAPGGEPHALTSLANGVSNPVWSPDGRQIAFLGKANTDERAKEARGEEDPKPTDKFEAKQRTERKEYEESERFDPREVGRIPYREGTSYLDDRYAQVYVIGTAEDSKPRRLTDVDANHEPPQWSADGQFILTSRSLEPDDDQPTRHSAIFRIAAETGDVQPLTEAQFTSAYPMPSPDGKWIAYLRIPRDEYYNEHIERLTLIPTEGGEPRELNIELDRSAGVIRWAADSSSVYFSANGDGVTSIYHTSVSGGEIQAVVSGLHEIASFDVAADGGIAFTVATSTNPSELYWQPASGEARAVTSINRDFLDSVIVQDTYEVHYTAPDGQPLQGWYMLPVGYEEGKTYPLILNIHGGPHAMWGAMTQSMWHENQSYTAAGYVVFFCNPRGSDGYGEAFLKALHANWGDVAYTDIMAGLDFMIEKGFIDSDRMSVTGGSYGGYMTAWIVGHTDRFKAAASQRGVYNLLGFFGTTDIPLFLGDEFGLLPWDDPMKLWEHSPLAYAHKITTPLLIIHSENDFRVPISEGEQLFAYVKRNGGTVKLVRFPRDGHELSRSGEPKHRVRRLQYIVDWFEKYGK
ncbi:MAG: S9 family peptidase [Anaerolineae bacterium]|nr:S9 family peptidase [Anaerolineae bacterium]